MEFTNYKKAKPIGSGKYLVATTEYVNKLVVVAFYDENDKCFLKDPLWPNEKLDNSKIVGFMKWPEFPVFVNSDSLKG